MEFFRDDKSTEMLELLADSFAQSEVALNFFPDINEFLKISYSCRIYIANAAGTSVLFWLNYRLIKASRF